MRVARDAGRTASHERTRVRLQGVCVRLLSVSGV